VNTLTFRNMDELFTTRKVARSGAVWTLPHRDHALDFTYSHAGATYTPEQFLERSFTNALLVMKDGVIVSEIYRNNTDAQTRHMAWSMTKSLTSLLVGFAVAEGRIKSVDEQIVAYLPELKGTAYDGVSIKQVLQMRSGVDYQERYDFRNPGVAAYNHEYALVRNAVRFVDAAKTIKRANAPGSTFAYKTIDTAVLGLLIERVSGGSNIAAYMAQRLWEPLGAESDGFFIMDGPPGVGREFNGAGFNATLRDFARVGQMMLDDGVANGKRIVPEGWVRESTAPTGVEGARGGYGYQWWTLANSDAYNALGLQGQYIFVDPATKTVVVKMSYLPPADQGTAAEIEAFLRAASAWSPKP
jgi:CubicO group peptidase (beta-lactamase class C family)